MQVAHYLRDKEVATGGGRTLRRVSIEQGEVVKENPITVLVRAPDDRIIKRHRNKHAVITIQTEPVNEETIV